MGGGRREPRIHIPGPPAAPRPRTHRQPSSALRVGGGSEWLQVYLHRLGSRVLDDVLLYEETDPAFFVDVKLTKDRVRRRLTPLYTYVLAIYVFRVEVGL